MPRSYLKQAAETTAEASASVTWQRATADIRLKYFPGERFDLSATG